MKLKNKNKITIAILLFSFILIFIGIYVSITEAKANKNYNGQEITYTPEPDTIKIDDTTASDKTNVEYNNNTEPVKESVPEEESPEKSYFEKNQETLTPTLEQQNDKKRSSLEMEYDIVIRYGEETKNYAVGDMGTTPITSSEKIKETLDELESALELYPQGFFREFSKKGMYLSVYLIDKYTTENVTGVTDPRTNNVTISIATAYPFSESFHHEIFHYIEKYIKANGGTFSSWEVFNPNDFTYGQENLNYAYINTLSIDSYFVNSYAETSADEDRASTFEFMMADKKASFFEKDKPIMNKANYIADVIDLFFTTVTSTTTEYWERYL